jgi:hypothetical protein
MATKEGLKMRPRSRAAFVAVVSLTLLIVLSAAFFLSAVIYGRMNEKVSAPPLLGNKPDNLARLERKAIEPRPFSFLVVGDTGDNVILEHFYNNIHFEASPDFGINLGDFVQAPELNRHRFFMREFAERGMEYPILLIAGNHDIVTDNDIAKGRVSSFADPFYPRDFEEAYGPANFSFTYAGCFFVGLNDVYNGSYIDRAKEILARRPPGSLMTFVFMHIPPQSLSPAVEGRGIEREDEFFRLVEEYRVDYVFLGDFHSYFRADRGHTKYIVTGGGGEDLYGGTKRSFFHVLFMKVDPEARTVDEIIYPIGKSGDIGDDIEILLLARLYPLFEAHPLLWGGLFSVIILLGLAGMVGLFAGAGAKSSKKKTRGKK